MCIRDSARPVGHHHGAAERLHPVRQAAQPRAARVGPADAVVLDRQHRHVVVACPPRGSGLRGLTDRVEALGGAMMVTDGPAGGTLLIARIPSRPVPTQPIQTQIGGTS